MRFELKSLRVPLAKTNQPLTSLVAKELGLPREAVKAVNILRESIDARKKLTLSLVYNLELELSVSQRHIDRLLKTNSNLRKFVPPEAEKLPKGNMPMRSQPVVVGAGPAGYFAALTLAAYGYAPVLLERGDDVDTRTRKVQEFWQGGELDIDSNVQFGEGGAGTFSDGKLTTRINDRRISQVLKTFVDNGAPPEILYKHKPHVGTDKLRTVVRGLRQQVESLGGEVRFQARVTGIKMENGHISGIEVNGNDDISAQVVVLAIGHSARDTYEMLDGLGVAMQAKAFAIGLRVEHPQSLVDLVQYGEHAGHPLLGAADYQLAYQDQETGRAAYAFCMCPGGKVVAATSEKNQVVTNGMSEYARDTGRANSALVVTVNPNDFRTPEALSGIEFQRNWERKAFQLGGGHYKAPAQGVQDFISDKISSKLELDSSYLPGVELANLRDALPKELGEVLSRAVENFDHKIPGFKNGPATFTGVETRTSAPLRILRNENMQSLGLTGLYPCGEGAGYAGGIMSAAVDGMKVAEAIIGRYAPPERRN